MPRQKVVHLRSPGKVGQSDTGPSCADCARSSVCKLGNSIMPHAPLLPARPVNDPHRILASSPGFGHSGVGLQCTSRLLARRRLCHSHFQESRRRAFAPPFLPQGEIRPAQSTLPAERSHIQSATRLLGNQLWPLRPCLLRSFGHVATLLCDTIFHKMGFV